MFICNRYNEKILKVPGDTLVGADLKGKNLYRACLQEKNLQGANMAVTNLKGANLEGTNLTGTNIDEADTQGAILKNATLPNKFILQAKDDFMKTVIMFRLNGEVTFLKIALQEGRVNGSFYEGECACLVGTLCKAQGKSTNILTYISLQYPDHDFGLHNPAENWFYQISKGDTPSTSQFSAYAVQWCDELPANG